MASSSASLEVFRFGQFEVDLRSRELRRDSVSVRLPDQSFEVLVMLLERTGELVAREEIQKRLWSADTFVDFDHGLNNAVNRLRDALGDSAEAPRFVETLPRRGYRFIGMVEGVSQDSQDQVPGDVLPGTPTVPRSSGAWRRVYRWVVIVAGLSALIAIIRWRVGTTPHSAIHALAVLPFQNFSGDENQDYFADGMTDELITMLAKNPGLRVISRTSVMRYKKVQPPIRKIASELGADGILEGSVARHGNRVHVTAQLIYAGNDTHVWAESYDRDLTDVSALQNELAQTIARQVGLTVSAPSKPEKPITSEAHDAYLMGRYYWFAENYKKSQPYFQKAIDLQPDYAAAWSGLSDSYVATAVMGEARTKDVIHQGEEAARKAVALGDSLAEAHNSIAGYYYFLCWDWARAERESARAVELNPSYAEAHRLRGYILETLNRAEESLEERKKAMELDPFSRPWALAQALLHARRFDVALSEARARSEAQPDNASLRAMLVDAYVQKGMEKEAAQEWEAALQLAENQDAAREVRQAFEQGGFKAVLKWKLTDLREQVDRGEYIPPLELADAYASLKLKNETLQQLEQAYQEHDPWLVHLHTNPTYDFLHSDPHYQAIVRKVGLPAAQ
jgi:TolB-like protein/DNA-binding winged helix-turn-helix (wHTH) protein